MDSDKIKLERRISAMYLDHNYAEVMRIAFMATAYMTEEQAAGVLRATAITMDGEDAA